MKKSLGFTLVELLVVISIISLLSSVVYASLNTARAKARDSQRIAALDQIKLALELYYDNHGQYPPMPPGVQFGENCTEDWLPTNVHLDTVLGSLVTEGYLPKLADDPRGPWPFCYFYQSPATYTHCPNANGRGYTLIFTTEATLFGNLQEYDIIGENGSKRRYCMYP